MSKSVPKLLQEANEIKKALEKIDDRLPEGLKAADMGAKMASLQTAVDEVDEVNVERTRRIDVKGERAGDLNDHIVQLRSAEIRISFRHGDGILRQCLLSVFRRGKLMSSRFTLSISLSPPRQCAV